MKPIRLTMQAFGSYGKKTEIDFTLPNQNLFLITGDTGSGKTTIFDAIVFALYGEASSMSNKKDGPELQSQYVSLDTKPYVELVFSERNGWEEEEYCVTRVPRHIRPARKKGAKDQTESESIALYMPDGSLYPEAEANQKLEELIGLSKSQFMQVAMIAQGEFMELLRADSNRKKEIFRKLFRTRLYQDITEELARRRRDKRDELGLIQNSCSTEAAHIRVPEEYPRVREMSEVLDRVLSKEPFSVTDMELLLEELQQLCEYLKQETEQAGKKEQEAAAARDRARDAYTEGQSLQQSYGQLKKAQNDLAECEKEEPALKEKEKLIRKIRDAFEIRDLFERFEQASQNEIQTSEKLKELKGRIGQLRKNCEDTEEAAQLADAEAQDALKRFAAAKERTDKSLEVFKQIDSAQKERIRIQNSEAEARGEAQKAKEDLGLLEQKEQEWKEEAGFLKDAPVILERWNQKLALQKHLGEELSEAVREQEALCRQQKQAEKAEAEYEKARTAYHAEKESYDRKQEAFLDSQAGFLAKLLRDGEPCPVCGSRTHPAPCQVTQEQEELTREDLEALAASVQKLELKRTEASAASGSQKALLQENTVHFKEHLDSILKQMQEQGIEVKEGSLQEDDSPQAVPENVLLAYQNREQMLLKEGEGCRKDAERLDQLTSELQKTQKKKEALQRAVQEKEQLSAQEQNALVRITSLLEGLMQQKGFDTEEEALKFLEDCRKEQEGKSNAAEKERMAAQKARSEAEHTDTLIRQYEEMLPELSAQTEKRREAYQNSLAEKEFAEEEARELTERYQKQDSDRFAEESEAFRKKKAEASGAYETALQMINGRSEPDLEVLREASEAAGTRLAGIRTILEQHRQAYQNDQSALEHLLPKMRERESISVQYSRIESLYSRLAGKESGARMDMETFVQRYYLQRILYAANQRFADMSAGQYELRMVDEEQAGAGKNRGLDLMVYSAVTGAERQIRTLSGGESFMAALSLALGMADQIQESAASIHLDMMFIDEGFGSLDEHSRDQAVRVLKQMAESSRMIGIISHVTELKQEVEDQLLVGKNEEGSYVKWQIS